MPLDHWESAHFTGQPCSWLDGAKEKSKAKNGPIGEEFGEGHRGTIKQVYGDRWCVYIMELCGITMACSGVETWFRLLESSGLSTKWFS